MMETFVLGKQVLGGHVANVTERRCSWVLQASIERITLVCMSTISLKLPDRLLELLKKESKARRTTKSSLVRECLEKQLPAKPPVAKLKKLPPGESFYDQALPILKKAWARNGRLPRDLATNPKYMKGFGE